MLKGVMMFCLYVLENPLVFVLVTHLLLHGAFRVLGRLQTRLIKLELKNSVEF